MRIGRLALSLFAIACPLGVHAQSGAQPKSEAATVGTVSRENCRNTPETIRACGEAWFKDCLKDWDNATHMSKKDYGRTCRRVVDGRVKALIEQGKSDASEKRKSAGRRP